MIGLLYIQRASVRSNLAGEDPHRSRWLSRELSYNNTSRVNGVSSNLLAFLFLNPSPEGWGRTSNTIRISIGRQRNFLRRSAELRPLR